MVEHVAICEWDEPDVDNKIILMPYPADIEELVEQYESRKGCRGVLPPYNNDQTFTARCASVVRDKIPEAEVIVAAVGKSRTQVAGFASALQDDGFDVMFPSMVGRQSIINLLHFWYQEYRDDIWYHVAGDCPPDHFTGTWTYSWEGI